MNPEDTFTQPRNPVDHSFLMGLALVGILVFGSVTLGAVYLPGAIKQHRVNSQDQIDPNDPDYKANQAYLNKMPAYQGLPYYGQTAYINYVDFTSDDKPILVVSYTDTEELAQTDYQEFLAKYHDNGQNYSLQFKQVNTLPTKPASP